MFQNPNPAPVKGSLKGTDRLEKRFDGIFIISDKVAFMSAAFSLLAEVQCAFP